MTMMAEIPRISNLKLGKKSFNIKTILVPTDFSETANHALIQAVEIAKHSNAKLVLMHVVELTAFTVPTELLTLGLITSQLAEETKEKLKELASSIKEEKSIKVEFRILFGSVYENIIRAAYLQDADLIIMGTHGKSGLKGWLFGSNAYIVVNNTTIPVLTIHHHTQSHSYKRIVFPFNENLLTLRKVNNVINLAKLFESIILLFGYSESDSEIAMISLRIKSEELTRLFKNENIPSTISLMAGNDYAQDIMKFAVESKADLITVATNGSHNVNNILESKPYRKLIHKSLIPVLSVPVE